MTLSVTLSVPATATTAAVVPTALSATPVNGITCVPDPNGSGGIIVENCTSYDDPATLGDEASNLILNVYNPTFTITDSANPSSPVTVTMPVMQARRGWRYPWLTSKIKQGNTDLINARLMLQYGPVGALLQPINALTYSGPADVPGITRYMGATGDRVEIGLTTEVIAIAMQTNNWSQALLQAEGCSAFPDIYRDKRTGQPVDKIQYPKANSYNSPGYRGSPWLAPAPSDYANDSNVIYMATNHLPSPFYAPALITLDPYFLERLQYNAEICALSGDSNYNGTTPMLMAPSEPRDFAWSVREVAMAAVATKEFEKRGILPANFKPSSYFFQIVSNVLVYYAQPLIADMTTDPRLQNFHQ